MWRHISNAYSEYLVILSQSNNLERTMHIVAPTVFLLDIQYYISAKLYLLSSAVC